MQVQQIIGIREPLMKVPKKTMWGQRVSETIMVINGGNWIFLFMKERMLRVG